VGSEEEDSVGLAVEDLVAVGPVVVGNYWHGA